MVIRGVIRPPPDIRAVVDKTALFVSKNGRAFESRILNSDKGKTTKFAFLHGTSPFHAYYEERIRFYEGGGKDGDDDADAGDGDGGDKDGTGGKKEEGGDEDATKEEEKARAEGGDEGAVGGDEKTATAGGAAVAPPAATGAGGGGGSSSKTRKATVDPVSRALLAERAELQRATAPPPPPPEKDDAKEGESEDADAAASPPTPAPAPAPVPLSSLAPPSLPFASMAAPSNATPAQLDVMRLTAQFACLTRVASDKKFASQSGGTFFDELKLREWNNPTFAFLQPRHGHFAYFTALVDGYRRILHLATATGKGEAGGGDLEAAVAGMMKRTELDDLRKSREEREACRRRRRGAEVRRGGLGASVGGGDGAGLGGCLRAAARRAEYDRLRREEEERKRSEAEGGGAAASDALGGVAAVDWHDFVVVETIDFAVDEEVQAPPPPPPPPPRKPSAVPRGKEEVVGGGTDAKPAEEEEDDEDMDMDTDDDDEEEEKIEIVSDYAPKIVSHASAAEDLTRTHMIDPITGKSVALADMSEHMRIQLLDPKWAEEKKRFMEKQKESNFVRGTDIAKNISRFAKQRGDIFGSSEAELLNQEEDSRKRLEEANRIIREQASLPQPQHQPQRESTAAAGNKRPSEPGYPRAPTGSSPRPEANASPPAKKPRPMTSAPSMPPPPPPLATFPAAPPPPATRSPPPPPPAASKPPPESSDAGFAQQSSVPPPPPPPPPPSAQQQPAKMSPPKPTPASDSDAPGSKAAPPAPADEPAEKETPAPPPAPVIPGVVHLSIQVPVAGPDDQQWSQWQFRGQTVSIKVDDAETATIKSIKERLRPTLGNMPLNKMQLKGGGGFLKDGVKLADVVRGPTEKMELVPKVRGGRK